MKPSRLVAMKTDAFTGYGPEKMVVVVSGSWPFGSGGCDRRDSNPHGLPHRILSPARLPVPPRSRDCCASTYAVGHRRDTGVWASVAFPPLRAAFSPCPASAGGSSFPPHDDSGGPTGAPARRPAVTTSPRGVVRGEGRRGRRRGGARGREVGARAVAGGPGGPVAAAAVGPRAAAP